MIKIKKFPLEIDKMKTVSLDALRSDLDGIAEEVSQELQSYIIQDDGRDPLILCPLSWYALFDLVDDEEILLRMLTQTAAEPPEQAMRRINLAKRIAEGIALEDGLAAIPRLEAAVDGHPYEGHWRAVIEVMREVVDRKAYEQSIRPEVLQAKAGPDFHAYILCKDGKTRSVDMKPYIRPGACSHLADPDFFRERICVMHGALAWDTFGDGSEYTCIDFDPGMLYVEGTVLDETDAAVIWAE